MNHQTYLDRMSDAYLDAAAWTDLDAETGDDEEDARREDCTGWASEAFDVAEKACSDFLERVETAHGWDVDELTELGWDAGQAGHDLWLTRNSHGTGFWDRGRGDAGDRLTDTAAGMGESDAYVGDDRAAYLS